MSERDGTATDDPTGAAPAVSLVDVEKTYRRGEQTVRAIDGITLELPRGSYTAVMGPSGSGKSTLMNLVGCLDTPTAGEVAIGGEPVGTLSEDERAQLRGNRVGFVFQTFNLMPRQTAAENVALPLVFQEWSRGDRIERAEGLLERVGLGDRTEHRPNELSGGQRQRVAIARALANDPAIVLADEPTGNLDTTTGRRIMGEFQRLHDAGHTILLVSHERHVAEHADRIVHLVDGAVEDVEDVAEPRRVPEPNRAGDELTGDGDDRDGKSGVPGDHDVAGGVPDDSTGGDR